jgi:hypothetical protein
MMACGLRYNLAKEDKLVYYRNEDARTSINDERVMYKTSSHPVCRPG